MWRKTLFWIHLSVGVTVGIVIFMMSATGVLLTYERQLLATAERSLRVTPPAPDAARLEMAALLAATRAHDPAFRPTAVTVRPDAHAPVTISAGRAGSLLVDPWTGEILDDGAAGLRAFFDAVTGWHRWFNVEREGRETARAVTGASNLLFLLLLLSGMYLWLPPVFRRAAFRTRLLFNPKATSAKARDFNWHHVFGIWTAIPLVVIVASALVFSYDWANVLVYRAAGEEPPPRGGPPGRDEPSPAGAHAETVPDRLDELLARVAAANDGWRRLTVDLPDPGDSQVRFTVDRGNGGQPQLRHDVTVDARTGDVLAREAFSDLSAGRRARLMIRFLHTGEALGVAGQTLAGIVSLASLFMVWTGLSLAWRRLVSPLLRRAGA